MYLASHRRNFSTNLFWLFYTILAQTQWFRNLDIKFEALCDLTIKSNNENSEFSNTTTSFENIIEAIEKIPDKPDVKTNYDNDPEAEFELIYVQDQGFCLFQTYLHQEFALYSIRGARNKTLIVIGFALFLLVFVFVFSFVSEVVKGWVSLAL